MNFYFVGTLIITLGCFKAAANSRRLSGSDALCGASGQRGKRRLDRAAGVQAAQRAREGWPGASAAREPAGGSPAWSQGQDATQAVRIRGQVGAGAWTRSEPKASKV